MGAIVIRQTSPYRLRTVFVRHCGFKMQNGQGATGIVVDRSPLPVLASYSWAAQVLLPFPCSCLLPNLPCLVPSVALVVLHSPCTRPCIWKERCWIGACRPFLCSFYVNLELLPRAYECFSCLLVQRSFLFAIGVFTRIK